MIRGTDYNTLHLIANDATPDFVYWSTVPRDSVLVAQTPL